MDSCQELGDQADQDEWVLLDTETTGLCAPVYAVEIAAQRFCGFFPQGPAFHAIVDPGVPIPPEATEVHGYTDDYVRRVGLPSIEAYGRLISYVGNRRIAAHFARFDWNQVLLPESQRLGFPSWGLFGFCTWALSRRALPECSSHRLDYLRTRFSLTGSRPHSALGDVEATSDLLTRFIFPRLSSLGFPTIQSIAAFSKLTPIQFCHFLAAGMPEDAAHARVLNLQHAQASRAAKTRERTHYIEAVEAGTIPLLTAIYENHLLADHPSVDFKGRRFLFTGTLAMGTRSAAAAAIVERGGLPAKSKAVSSEVDYLVLGSKTWEELESGRKLKMAVIRRLRGLPTPMLLLEEDFVAALGGGLSSLAPS
jgi:DNA polymerase III epsilon subunit-like protein